MVSKKEGYVIDETSLNRFIMSKQKRTQSAQNQVSKNLISDTHNNYNSGIKEIIIKEAISLREKGLILKKA